MFLPPEQRQPGPRPPEPSPRRRALSAREEAVLPWIVCFVVLTMVLAPIGGSSLVNAIWYLVKR